MRRPDMSLLVVGGLHSNKDGGNRQFEISMCLAGEPVSLVPEPSNPVDPSAVGVLSARGIQIGYVSAERCGWIGARLRLGEAIVGVFQKSVRGGAVIRIGFDGNIPIVPPALPVPDEKTDDDSGFYPDDIPPDDWDSVG